MLLDHYGLREQPFGVTPNPRYLYLSPSHREALASLVYGIESGRGFLALIAAPGMGKTTLLFQFLERLGSRARTVFLFQAQSGARGFLRSMMADLGISAEEDGVALQTRLNQILLQELQAGRKFVLVVDEAQNLDDASLEFVRMLSNFETPRDKLIHIVLAGQTELAQKLARPSMIQLRQRISMLIRLHPLGPAEIAEYIDHRLRVAGYSGSAVFSAAAVSAIASLSGGIPRNINNICFNALSLGYAGGQRKIESAIVREVAADLDLSTFSMENAGVLSSLQAAEPAEDTGVRRSRNDSTRAEGWAVLLDRILSPGRESGPRAGAASGLGVKESWGQGSRWKETVESLAGRLRDRMVH
ncbi:MAG TPA: AAA family ATPase [Terriglobia bacterium]